MALETEIATYRANLPRLHEHVGKFVLICGNDIVDYFSTYEDAIKEGYQKYGTKTPFLVRQIQAVEQAHFISRLAKHATV